MSIFVAIILGLIQGLTEFIPVSSSGHLVIASQILNVGDAFTFDVLINFGTLLALIIFYQKRIWLLIKRAFKGKEWGLLLKLFIATIPAATIGIIFDERIEAMNYCIWLVVATLVIVGILMIVKGRQKDDADASEIEKSISFKRSIYIGIAQALALIPGTSRSGITILTGLNTGLTAKRAAEFSFLLAIPTIAGASIKTLISSEGLKFIDENLGAFIVGNVVSFLSGLLAINFLISLIGRRGLKDFGWYRISLALVLAILLLAGII